MRSGEGLAEGGDIRFQQEFEPVFRFCGFFFADAYFVNKVVARLCANGFTVVCTNGRPAFKELVSENVSSLGLWQSADIFDHGKGKSLRSELKFVWHILYGKCGIGNAECGARRLNANAVSQSLIRTSKCRVAVSYMFNPQFAFSSFVIPHLDLHLAFRISRFIQITSANDRSVFLKYQMPVKMIIATIATERAKPGQ
jgi:hypothetical protein